MELVIRPEMAGDHGDVARVVAAAFESPAHGDLVAALRTGSGARPEMALVAVSEDRVFLLIDPNLNTSKVDVSFLHQQGLVANAIRLLAMSAGEMTARDWLRVDRVNTEIEWRDRLVAEPPQQVADLHVFRLVLESLDLSEPIDESLVKKHLVGQGKAFTC